MGAYCMRCHRKTQDANARMAVDKNGKSCKKSTCATCGTKKNEYVQSGSRRKGTKGGAIGPIIGSLLGSLFR